MIESEREELERYRAYFALKTAGVDVIEENKQLKDRLNQIEKYATHVQELDNEQLINLVQKGWVK